MPSADRPHSPWRYGVALFPLSVLFPLGALLASDPFVAVSLDSRLSEADVLAGVARFVLTVVASWLVPLVGLVVPIALALDARALRRAGASFGRGCSSRCTPSPCRRSATTRTAVSVARSVV